MLDYRTEGGTQVRPEIRRFLRQLSELGEEEILLNSPRRQASRRRRDLALSDTPPATPSDRPSDAPSDRPSAGRAGADQTPLSGALLLADLQHSCRGCTLCRLCADRTQVVFGAGDPDAHAMFVGEAPGGDEDRQGKPFVGRAGKLLTKIIEAMQLKREDVYIANVIKCRPPGNRTPSGDEVACCIPYLRRQIEIIGPKVICALGRVAAQALLGTGETLAKIRGRVYRYGDSRLVVTYHPAALLRDPSLKRVTWEDVKVLRRELDGVEL